MARLQIALPTVAVPTVRPLPPAGMRVRLMHNLPTLSVATKLAFTQQPAGASAGQIFSTQPIVVVQDASGATVTGFSGNVTITSSGGTLGGTTTVAVSGGIATFTNLTLTPAGAYTLTAASTGLTSATSSTLNVQAAPVATALAFLQQPTGLPKGGAFSPLVTVRVLDQFGNLYSGYSGSVAIAISSGGGLTGTTTATVTSGIATFSSLGITFGTAPASYTLSATSGILTGTTSTSFAVAAFGAAAKVVYSQQPGGAAGNVAFTQQPIVLVQDTYGNTVTTATGTVTLVIKPGTGTGGATFLAGATSVTASVSSGVATFSGVGITQTGSGYVLTASDASLTTADSASFTVAAGAPTALVFQTQPGGAAAGTAFTQQPVIYIKDAGGNLVTTSSAPVTLTIKSGTGTAGATLGGTVTVNASAGIVTFSGLSLDKYGTGYVLTASGASLTVDSTALNNVIAYLTRDMFTAVAAAPLTSPASAEPTGTRTIVDTTNVLFKTGGRLRGGTQFTSPAWGNSQVVYEGHSRVQGRMLTGLLTPEDSGSFFAFLLATSTSPGTPATAGHGLILDAAGALEVISPSVKVVLDSGANNIRAMQYLVTIVEQSQGALVCLSTIGDDTGAGMAGPISIPVYPNARILHVDASSTTATLYAALSYYNSTGLASPGYFNGHAADDVRLFDVTTNSAYTTLDGLATMADRFVRANSSTSIGTGWANDSGVHGITSNTAKIQTSSGGFDVAWKAAGADGIFTWIVNIGSDATHFWGGIMRRQGVGSYIRVTNNGTNNTIYIQSLTSNSFDASIYSVGVTWAANTTYVVTVLAKGNQYRIFINGVAVTTWQTDTGNSGAGFHTTGTGIGVLNVSSTTNAVSFSGVFCYPHTITLPAEVGDGHVPYVTAGTTTLSADSFTGTAGTRLNAHTMNTGGGWTEVTETWTLDSSGRAASTTAGTSDAKAVTNVGSADVEVQFDVIMPASFPTGRAFAGGIIRYTDANNLIWWRTFHDPSQVGNDEIEIYEIVGGVQHANPVVHKVPLLSYYVANGTYTFMARAKGDTIHIFLDGKPRLTFITASNLTGTYAGLYRTVAAGSVHDDGCVFDNWQVKQLT